ncbi:DUF309 domain-containing protein [Streptomyces sp. NPDC058045]|uniref:DUF309 domain-containing protein n=1 Tax=Streptomyces sp. NPDC058045 TaxID=3346311 RepID=UPI0036EDC799
MDDGQSSDRDRGQDGDADATGAADVTGAAGASGVRRDRDAEGRARNARPRDGLGRPLPYGSAGVERQPEGVRRSPAGTLAEAQQLLDAGRPFHAHEVFEDAWKSGPAAERPLWRGLAQMAVGLTHAARGNARGGARLLRRGARSAADWSTTSGQPRPYGLALADLATWAETLAARLDADPSPVDPSAWSPTLGGGG